MFGGAGATENRENGPGKAAILGEFSFVRESSDAERKRFAEDVFRRRLAAGACFYREGEYCASFALVHRGEIRVFKTGRTGHEITLYHVEGGQPCLVNMLSVFLGQPAIATAVVEAPTEVLTVSASAFRNWVRESDAVRRFVFATMATRLIDVTMLVEEVAFERMDRRLANLLLKKFSAHEIALRVLSTTHEELAAELGTAREVVSRLLKHFEGRGAILLSRGRVELRDARLLQQLAQPDGENRDLRD